MATAAGPSRLPPQSTSGDSESTVLPPVTERVGPDVGVLRELGKQALVEALNDVSNPPRRMLTDRCKAPRRSFSTRH